MSCWRGQASIKKLLREQATEGPYKYIGAFEAVLLMGILSAILLLPVPENMRFLKAGSLLLDSQVPSPPQLCPWNLFLVQDGRLD